MGVLLLDAELGQNPDLEADPPSPVLGLQASSSLKWENSSTDSLGFSRRFFGVIAVKLAHSPAWVNTDYGRS